MDQTVRRWSGFTRSRKASLPVPRLNTYRSLLAIVHESRLTAKRDRTLRFNHAGRRFTIHRVVSHRQETNSPDYESPRMMVDLWLSMGTRCWLHFVYVSTFTTSIEFRDQIALRGYILNLAKHSRVPFSDTAEVKVATSPLGTASKSTHVCSFRATCPFFFSRLVACEATILKRLDCKEHDACSVYAVMKFMTLQTREFKFVNGRDSKIVLQRRFWIGFMEEYMTASNWCHYFYFMGDVHCFGILWRKKAHYCIITLYLIFFATFISQLF